MNKIVTRINWVNDTDPAINDTHLNQMDSELDAIDDRVIAMEATVEAQAENAEAWANGTRGGEAIDPSDPAYHKDAKYQAEQAASSASDAATSETNAGTSATAASNSATAAANKALVSEGFAKGTQNGVPVKSESPYFENNAEYFKNQAAQIVNQSLAGLNDVTISAPTNGQILKYNAATQKWENTDETVGIAPDNVSGIAVVAGDGTLTVKWSDPDDTVVEGQTICTWSKTKLVLKVGSYPSNENDGTVVVTNSVRNQYATNGYVITGLTNDTTYYFQLFPISDGNAVNRNTTNRGSGTPRDVVPVTLTINGGYEDTILVKNTNDELIATCVFPSGSISGSCLINVPAGGITVKVESTVYKIDASTYFSKTVALTLDATQTVEAYPEVCWYWHGRKCAGNLTLFGTSGTTVTEENADIKLSRTTSTNVTMQSYFAEGKNVNACTTLHVECECPFTNSGQRVYFLSTSAGSSASTTAWLSFSGSNTRAIRTATIASDSGTRYLTSAIESYSVYDTAFVYSAWAD